MKNKLYFFGIYKDYSDGRKIAQMSEIIDSLSCEILADPGVIRIYEPGVQKAWREAKKLAMKHDCSYLESMTITYKFIKLNP